MCKGCQCKANSPAARTRATLDRHAGSRRCMHVGDGFRQRMRRIIDPFTQCKHTLPEVFCSRPAAWSACTTMHACRVRISRLSLITKLTRIRGPGLRGAQDDGVSVQTEKRVAVHPSTLPPTPHTEQREGARSTSIGTPRARVQRGRSSCSLQNTQDTGPAPFRHTPYSSDTRVPPPTRGGGASRPTPDPRPESELAAQARLAVESVRKFL